MILSELLNSISYNNINHETLPAVEIQDITYDSRKSKAGSIFVAIKGETIDGHKFAPKAYENGCRIFIVSENVSLPSDAIIIEVENSRIALSQASNAFFGKPSQQLTVIGVTGTKGKTTTTNFIKQTLESSGIKTGVIGTNGAFYCDIQEETINTTPESYELHRIFKNMLNHGVQCVCMEVSSGGLMMHRVNDIDFDIAVFTNISPDHIGPKEHKSFQDYLSCKAQLFSMAKISIINADDAHAEDIISVANKAKSKVLTFGLAEDFDYSASDISYSNAISSLETDFLCKEKSTNLSIPYSITSPGIFSVYNALTVIATCRALNLSHETIKKALKTAQVSGRVEVINILPASPIVLDYAHNKVSLTNLLETLQLYKPKRLLCLFGSIGGRATMRRKELGDVAAKYADIAIVTSDNPDFEDPEQIIEIGRASCRERV